MKKMIFLLLIPLLLAVACNRDKKVVMLFSDDYSNLPGGPLGNDVGAHTEYHYLPEAGPKGNWAISTFKSGLPPSWYVREINEKKVLFQKGVNSNTHWHPMIVAGDQLWGNYTIHTSICSLDKDKQCGIAFRYKNDRCYYILGLKQDTAFIKMVNHATAYHKPLEKYLASESFIYDADIEQKVIIEVNGDQITAGFENGPFFNVSDTTYKNGKIAFLADGPAYFGPVNITCDIENKRRFENLRKETELLEQQLRAGIPKPVLWKSIKTGDFGVGRNLRFGDLNEDGQTDVLIGQVIHHGPKDRNSELSCLTAMTFDGDILWQIGKPDPWKNHLTNDVAFQIHDIDNDGQNEVIYCMNQMMIVADGRTGKVKYQAPTPYTPGGNPTAGGQNIFDRILGDCLFFCDLEGKGYDGNIIIKDRYTHLWALNGKLQVLWENECNTGHYPYAYDVDDDGRDELIMGYTLFDDNGKKLWTLDETLKDHADGVAVVEFNENEGPRLLCAASDEGMVIADLEGHIIRHHFIGHVQNPAIANFRDDKPGLEVVSVNFWGNQGIIHLYDSEGNIYHDFEPNQFGSMCLPLNWTGRSEEFFLLNANVELGGAFDGWGRKVMEFPDDGHPDMCNAVLDITGDCRDEIIVWDPNEIWVYTQDDGPKQEKLYKPVRNALYNYSNYQATVSLPGWSDPDLNAQAVAFPGAEGFGAYSRGGRGGDVYTVTNLNDSGTGSLRYGIKSATGPRTIVFSVSGLIHLKEELKINKDNITIAGQTAPGDGICLRDASLSIEGNHIIVRYIRSRLGDESGTEGDAITISRGHNIIMDHCSASWSVDECFSCSTGEAGAIDSITVQWSIISEALNNSIHHKGDHGYGALIRGCHGAKYTYHHNLFAHNQNRNPRPGNYDRNDFLTDPDGLQFDFRNNVMYNWGGSRPGYDSDTKSVCRYNYVGNYGKPGPESNRKGYAYSAGSKYFRGYYSDNFFYGEIPEDQWSLVSFSGEWSAEEIANYKQTNPFSTGPIVTESPLVAYTNVLAHAGTSLVRDNVDKRVIRDVKNGTGSFIDHESEVGGWPEYNTYNLKSDSDLDGMPDEWEIKAGLDPNDPSDRNGDQNGDRYTNLENYLNSLVPDLSNPDNR